MSNIQNYVTYQGSNIDPRYAGGPQSSADTKGIDFSVLTTLILIMVISVVIFFLMNSNDN